MRKLLGYLFTPFHYFFFILLLLIFHPLQWISLKLGGYSAHKKTVDALNFFLVGTYYIAGIATAFYNKYDLPRGRSIIFVSNHQSSLDVPALIWYLRKYHVKFVSKIELTRGIPSVSFNLKHGGAANIDRNDPRQSMTEILKLAQRMREYNWSAAIFPEGTRTRDGRMKAFHEGGVATLIKKVPDVLVVPIVINGSWQASRYGKYPLNFGQKISYTVLQPIEPTGKNPVEVVKEAESAIRSALQQ